MQTLTTILLWFAAIGCGLLGGLYFAFSAFIMAALGRIDRASGLAAMNAINAVILRSLFMPVFLGTTLASLVLAILGMIQWGLPGAWQMAVGGALYVLGMFGVTMVFNVPLNNALAASDGDAALLRYLRDWTRWNHVRTLASTGASILFTMAIAAR